MDKESIKTTFNEQSPTVRLIIIVVILLTTIIVVYKVSNWWKNRQLDDFKAPSDVNGNTLRDPRPLIDQIYEKIEGYNLYYYPEVINKLANLNQEEMAIAVNYYNSEYKYVTGESLYEFIDGEWHAGMYDPALEKLERYGYR